MNRFFGLMPESEVEKHRTFRDAFNILISIEAGPKGYTIIWGDQSTSYEDIDDTTDNNFKKAYEIADKVVGPLKGV